MNNPLQEKPDFKGHGWLSLLDSWISIFINAVGKATAWCAVGLVLVTCLVVILRYLFDQPSISLQESMTYLHACLFMLGAAYTLKSDGHVRVDVFYRKFSLVNKAWINLMGSILFLLPMCVLIVWLSIDYVVASWNILEGSPEPNGLPIVYILKSLIIAMPVLLILQALSIILEQLMILMDAKKKEAK